MILFKRQRQFAVILLSLTHVESFFIDPRQYTTTVTSALQASASNHHHHNNNNNLHNNNNYNNKSNAGVNGNGTVKPNVRIQKSAMESAVLVEWEPVSELERRIEDGILYEHWPVSTTKTRVSSQKAAGLGEDSIYMNKITGVFCGLRVTNEEYMRLKSADPKDVL